MWTALRRDGISLIKDIFVALNAGIDSPLPAKLNLR